MPIFSLDGKNLLFIHVPKCGGSSIEDWAKLNGFTVLLEMRGQPIQDALLTSPQHYTMAQLKSIVSFENIDYIFMFVRNPISRIKSEYCWQSSQRLKREKQESPFWRSLLNSGNSKSNPQLVEDWLINMFSECRKNPFFLDNHIRPTVDFIEGEFKNIHIFKLEDGFTTFLNDMENLFGKKISRIPHKKNSNSFKQDFSTENIRLNDFCLKLIRDFYYDDFKYFGFTIPIFNKEINL
jgi:hypothetical protein